MALHVQGCEYGVEIYYSKAHTPCFLQLAMGKMMEQGPVLIVTFQAQLVMVIKNPKGEVFDGDPVSGRE